GPADRKRDLSVGDYNWRPSERGRRGSFPAGDYHRELAASNALVAYRDEAPFAGCYLSEHFHNTEDRPWLTRAVQKGVSEPRPQGSGPASIRRRFFHFV